MDKKKIQDLLNAADALGAFVDQAQGFHAEHELAHEAAQKVAVLVLARLYVVEFARHATAGMEETDALLTTLRGDTKFSPGALRAITESVRRALH